jgi:hypothetical protein
MEKKHLEISVSTGLVIFMIIMMLVIQMVAPEGLRSIGFTIVMVIFIVVMGFAGVKLLDM